MATAVRFGGRGAISVVVATKEGCERSQGVAGKVLAALKDIERRAGRQIVTTAASSPAAADLIISIGGDGTLLRAASAFPGACPPILPIHAGRLGFMLPLCM